MADNYLEKRMDDYRSKPGKSMRKTIRKTHAIFITDPLSTTGVLALKTHLSDPRAHIAFASPSSATARDLAQKTGSRYYPIAPTLTLQQAIDDARAHYHPLPLTIIDTTTPPRHKTPDPPKKKTTASPPVNQPITPHSTKKS